MNPLSFNAIYAGFANQLYFLETIIGISHLCQRECVVYGYNVNKQHKHNKKIIDYLKLPFDIKTYENTINSYDTNLCFHDSCFNTDGIENDLEFSIGRKNLSVDFFKSHNKIQSFGFGFPSSFFYGSQSKNVKEFLRTIQFIDEIEEIKLKLLKKIDKKFGLFNALHIRQGDIEALKLFKKSDICSDSIYQDIYNNHFSKEFPIIVFTDDKNFYLKLENELQEYNFIYFDELAKQYTSNLDYIAILSILVGSHSFRFLGTYGSTFTALIHRTREFNGLSFNFKYITDFSNIKKTNENSLPIGTPYSWNDKYYRRYQNSLFWMREWKECI